MDWIKAIFLMPTLLVRCEPYIVSIKLLGFSYWQAVILNLIGTNLAASTWFFIIVVAPHYITLPEGRFKLLDKIIIWHRKRQQTSHHWAEKFLGWLRKKRIFFLFPLFIFLMSAISIPIPLPLALIAISLIKILNYTKKGLFIILIANIPKTFLVVSVIYKLFLLFSFF